MKKALIGLLILGILGISESAFALSYHGEMQNSYVEYIQIARVKKDHGFFYGVIVKFAGGTYAFAGGGQQAVCGINSTTSSHYAFLPSDSVAFEAFYSLLLLGKTMGKEMRFTVLTDGCTAYDDGMSNLLYQDIVGLKSN